MGLVGALLLGACATPAPPTDTEITLIRSPCLFQCPYYQVVIRGDGQVTYTGYSYVKVTGEQHATIPRSDVEHLLSLFDRAHFFQLQHAYRAQIYDIPTFVVRLKTQGREMEVQDYMGEQAGMPHDVAVIENEIDRVAGTQRWVRE
jgi:hypothetical protein